MTTRMPVSRYSVYAEMLLQRHSEIIRPYLGSAGLNEHVLEHPERELSQASFVQLLEVLGREVDDAIGLRLGLGLLSTSSDGSSFGVFGHALRSAPSIPVLFDCLIRYVVVYSQGLEMTWAVRGNQVEVTYQILDPNLTQCRQDVEFAIATLFTLICQVTGQPVLPLQVDFEHARPADISLHQQTFQCPLRFDQTSNRVLWTTAILDLQVLSADPRLFHMLQPALEDERNKRLVHTELLAWVAQAIAANLKHGKVSLHQVAKDLCMSSRTLQRRLQQAQVEFQELVEEIRCTQALDYVRNSTHTFTDIAMLLGYTEASSFTRAFRRWTFVTPRQYREQARQK